MFSAVALSVRGLSFSYYVIFLASFDSDRKRDVLVASVSPNNLSFVLILWKRQVAR